MSAIQPTASGSRSRPQARKKANDDGAYLGSLPASTGISSVKRQATDKAEGEPRTKRKRVDAAGTATTATKKDVPEEQKLSLVEFNKMPMPVLHRYLSQFDIVPVVYPSPLSVEDPPSPSSLTNPLPHASRAPSPPVATPANRPRREPKDQNRRRSSRLLEEESRSQTPILADVEELHTVLAGMVEKHFREMSSINGREEVDTLASFMCAVEKAKGARSK
ncbi:hypothetical protein BDQ12DRAFT_678625 [Crucibulum laeve]|uniref:Histone deacetylase complex subunit SAP30 Sin3 binding domain-containing protein n=1 Tax=Crucibulum laeve TaxID=68775 RepID=A0A5C3MAX1_9AGAR|nr:hypothetical protein BDQ12DRAFT_678625 [Crucibulum laeve]